MSSVVVREEILGSSKLEAPASRIDGEGAGAIVLRPLARANRPRVTPGPSDVAATYSLLVVDVDEASRSTVRQLIEPTHTLVEASSVAEALKALREHSIDCVLLAHALVGADGLLEHLVVSGRSVILLTDTESEHAARAALKRGAQDYLGRGALTQSCLMRSLRYAVERGRALRESQRARQERQQFEEQLRQTQKLEALGRLAGGVAHDFNNLLTAIISFSRFVLDDLTAGDHRREDMMQVLKAADRAQGLTRQLLAFSRKQPAEPRIVDVNELLTNLQPLLRRTISADIELLLDLEPTSRRVLIDAGQLEQVVLNLVVNARDAMPNGGRVTIETRHVPASANGGRELISLQVIDTGVGMAHAVKARIFEPFFSTKAPNKGTGLGLSTCYGIVKQAQGEIEVHSVLGEGSTFRVLLPCAAPGTAARNDDLPATAGVVTGAGTILVVEDDDSVRAVVTRMLRRHGYSAVPVASAAEAQALFHEDPARFALLLSDVIMPAMRGPELATRLVEQSGELGVLFMTGYDDDSISPAVCDALPTHDIIRKPFVETVLLEKVARLLEKTDRRGGAAKTAAPARHRKPKVLVIDDEPAMLRALGRLLERTCDVTAVHGGMEHGALFRSLSEAECDLVICDMMLDGVSGFDVIDFVRGSRADLGDKIVLMTGAADECLLHDMKINARVPILRKPLRHEDIMSMMKARGLLRAE